jgi:hypothetical protein
MRHRLNEAPPESAEIDKIVGNGADARDSRRFPEFLRRFRNACFLDNQNRRLTALERLIAQYRKDGLVLFLGAGVSRGSGIPNWPGLTSEVLKKSGILPKEGELDRVQRALPAFITQFELAGLRLGETEFTTTVYDSLYGGTECKPLISLLRKIPQPYKEQKNWRGWRDVLKALETNETLKAVADLLIVGGRQPRCNPQIRAVVTFNADNLLEIYCQAKTSGRRLVKSVDRASVGEHPDTIPVYHLHGFLDARGENIFRPARPPAQGRRWQKITPKLLPELVFRESEYYETIANPTSFVNHMPQSFLRSLNALFIGTSLDDLNMRRWLHDSYQERVLHRTKYLRELYEEEYSAAERDAKLESRRHFWLRSEVETEKGGKLWRVPKEHVELIMSNLGVQVVWCKGYPDVCESLRNLHTRGRDPKFGRRVAQFPH